MSLKPRMNPFVSVLLDQVEKMDSEDYWAFEAALADWWMRHAMDPPSATIGPETDDELIEILHRTLRSKR